MGYGAAQRGRAGRGSGRQSRELPYGQALARMRGVEPLEISRKQPVFAGFQAPTCYPEHRCSADSSLPPWLVPTEAERCHTYPANCTSTGRRCVWADTPCTVIHPPEEGKGRMNVLPTEKRVHILGCLVEGNSIRSTERLTEVHRETILNLLLQVGGGCHALHDRMVRGLNCAYIELDEVWAFVWKKQGRLTEDDPEERGDAYTFVAEDAASKLTLCWRTDKRTLPAAVAFAADLRGRVLNRPQITADGFTSYPEAIEQAFGCEVDFGQAIKVYGGADGQETDDHRYSVGRVRRVTKRKVIGSPDEGHMTTSHMERQNLGIRMACRRFTRLTNAFSKSLRHLTAAVALHYVYQNLCWVHGTIRCTPAMQAGLTDHVWGLEELLEAAMEKALAPAPESRRQLRVAMPTAHEEPPPAAPPVPPTPTQPPAPAPPLPSDGEVPEPPVFCASPTTPESAEPVAPAVVAGLAADEMGQLSLLSWVAPPRDGEQLSLF